MGRKIPAKKHRGVKDPLEQQARRLQSLKSKINAPPKDPDEQPAPRSLARLFAFQNNFKLGAESIAKKKNKKKVYTEDRYGSGVGDNPISRLRKLPGESGRGFSLRINSAIRTLHGDVTQDDYPQDIEDEEDAKGSRMEELRERRARKRRRATGGAPRATAVGASDQPPRLTHTQKLALKKKAKIDKAEESARDRREVVYERVPFGDVAHAPPTLRPPRAAAAANGAAPRPGRRDLLLNKMLAGGGGDAARVVKARGASAGASPAEALRRERARMDAVLAYRALKAAEANKRNKPA